MGPELPRASIPLSLLGVEPGETIGLWTDGYSTCFEVFGGTYAYTVGDYTRDINMDGNPEDWTEPYTMFTDLSGEVTPEELDWIAYYTTNNQTHLFHRADLQTQPTRTFSSGGASLLRFFQVYYDTDRDNTTGSSILGIGAEYRLVGSFVAELTASISAIELSWYNSTSDNWQSLKTDSNLADWNTTLEWGMPITDIGVTIGSTIDIFYTSLDTIMEDFTPNTGWIEYTIPLPCIGHLNSTWKNAMLVLGTSEPYGPLPWGAMIDDTVGAIDLAVALGDYGTPSSAFDTEVAEWGGASFSWKPDSPSTMVAVGGTGVNLISYEYNQYTHFNLSVFGEYVELKVDADGIDYIRLYFDPLHYVVHYTNGTETQYGYEGNNFAEAYACYDSVNSKYVFLVMGISAEGTIGTCRYLAMNIDSFPTDIANAKGIILHWQDTDGDGIARGDEMTVIATYS